MIPELNAFSVAPPFHYVEKGDENDAAISCCLRNINLALSSRKRNFVAKISPIHRVMNFFEIPRGIYSITKG
jgi:hypothetical protein